MNEVRVIEFLATPLAKTPVNAARKERRKTTLVQRTVSPLQPTRRFGHDPTGDFEMLEASRMDRTEVTQGDLGELCESSVGNQGEGEGRPFENMLDQSEKAERPSTVVRGQNIALLSSLLSSSNSELLAQGSPASQLPSTADGSAHTPASVESASRTLTEKSVLEAELEALNEDKQGLNNKGEGGVEISNKLPLSNRSMKNLLNLIQINNTRFRINDHSRFVTTRDDESMARSNDDVFLAEEESESFKQQVSCFKIYLCTLSRSSAPISTYIRQLQHANISISGVAAVWSPISSPIGWTQQGRLVFIGVQRTTAQPGNLAAFSSNQGCWTRTSTGPFGSLVWSFVQPPTRAKIICRYGPLFIKVRNSRQGEGILMLAEASGI